LRGFLLALTAILVAVFGRWITGNQGAVIPAVAHRSGQLNATLLRSAIVSKKVRTVLNLRGGNPDQAWYRDERRVTIEQGAALVDFAMASDMYLSRIQASTLIDILDKCEKPVLIHCQWGAERTGLASAFVELLKTGGSVSDAKRQFSPYYLFLPARDGLVMRRHLDLYEGWLREQGLRHSPDVFRRWIRDEYRPASPSREEWPYDPYPLVVVHRPSSRPGFAVAKSPSPEKTGDAERLK
jgi:hypothetical protein